ncbi:tRNA pseudouridine(38-40) synthase TruA [Candidatus Dependentiae bacterium]
MQRYKIIIAYDGTDYCGWQRQKCVPSVAQRLEDTFDIVFGKKISLMGVSRTDTGVHALGQVAAFRTDFDIKPEKMFQAWNNMLPPDIVIRKLDLLGNQAFNIHKDVELKTYYYHFFTQRPLPFVQRYGWFYRYPVDLEKLQKALNVFLGKHDFRSFCTGDERENTVRIIKTIYLEYFRRYNGYRIVVEGPKFLRYMIRRIVGAAIEVASRDNMSISYLQEVIDQKDSEQTLPNAPAKGLLLYKVAYKGE